MVLKDKFLTPTFDQEELEEELTVPEEEELAASEEEEEGEEEIEDLGEE